MVDTFLIFGHTQLVPKELTYADLLQRLNELLPTELAEKVVIAKGRKTFPLYDMAVASECKGEAVKSLGEMAPVLICNP